MDYLVQRIIRMTPLKSWLACILQVICFSIMFLGISTVAGIISFGSMRAGKAWLSGLRIFVENPRVEQKFEASESFKEIKFQIRNLSRQPISILGSNSSCTCTLIQELPGLIPVGGSIFIAAIITIDPKQIRSTIEGNIRIFTGLKENEELLLRYRLSPSESETSNIPDHNSRTNRLSGIVFR